MFKIFAGKFIKRLFRLRWPIRRRSISKCFFIKSPKPKPRPPKHLKQRSIPIADMSAIHPNGQSKAPRRIRIATFNAALFSMAPAVSIYDKSPRYEFGTKSANTPPRSILKQSPRRSSPGTTTQCAKSKMRVSINLPENEISMRRNGRTGNDAAMDKSLRRSVVEVLREMEAEIVALQDVKADEEKSMKPLSDLAAALGMNYVFAESWAPEYGNAVLSKWPIKRWKVHKVFDQSDFRNILKATIDVPQAGEVNFYCTHLDHLDEDWRMKQIHSIIHSSSDAPHILAGGLNSLDHSDYSTQRWSDIVQYCEEMGKPPPKSDVMRFLKDKHYIDAKDFSGECESVVIIAKGQSVQGTSKYGTRVDYIMASPGSPYKFVPGSYSVVSSKGTSDHHIVKVDMFKVQDEDDDDDDDDDDEDEEDEEEDGDDDEAQPQPQVTRSSRWMKLRNTIKQRKL